jgi:hypothetical protein
MVMDFFVNIFVLLISCLYNPNLRILSEYYEHFNPNLANYNFRFVAVRNIRVFRMFGLFTKLQYFI